MTRFTREQTEAEFENIKGLLEVVKTMTETDPDVKGVRYVTYDFLARVANRMGYVGHPDVLDENIHFIDEIEEVGVVMGYLG